jgi:hypothetical protein
MKYSLLTLLLLAAATTAYSQRSYRHTIYRSDGSDVTYRTTCSSRHCYTTVRDSKDEPKGGSDIYTGPPLPDKKFCKAMRKAYGDNLERFRFPISYNTSFCIADEALQLRIRAANDVETIAGRPGKTMNPLYKPPTPQN